MRREEEEVEENNDKSEDGEEEVEEEKRLNDRGIQYEEQVEEEGKRGGREEGKGKNVFLKEEINGPRALLTCLFFCCVVGFRVSPCVCVSFCVFSFVCKGPCISCVSVPTCVFFHVSVSCLFVCISAFCLQVFFMFAFPVRHGSRLF